MAHVVSIFICLQLEDKGLFVKDMKILEKIIFGVEEGRGNKLQLVIVPCFNIPEPNTEEISRMDIL